MITMLGDGVVVRLFSRGYYIFYIETYLQLAARRSLVARQHSQQSPTI